jgi:hypothetical protein
MDLPVSTPDLPVLPPNLPVSPWDFFISELHISHPGTDNLLHEKPPLFYVCLAKINTMSESEVNERETQDFCLIVDKL